MIEGAPHADNEGIHQDAHPGEFRDGNDAFTQTEYGTMDPGLSGITPATKSALGATPEAYEGSDAETPANDERLTEVDRIMAAQASVAHQLTDPVDAPRAVVGSENERVDAVLDEPTTSAHTSVVHAGRAVLTKVGLLKPEIVDPTAQARHAERVAVQDAEVKSLLDISRQTLRDGTVEGVDDVIVDGYLGVRAEESMLPPLFRDLHRQAEAEAGHPLTFIKWMAEYATDEQLTNVWQWHDQHLETLDNDPSFQEMATRVKQGYVRGRDAAITGLKLHPSIAQVPVEEIENIRIAHGSPFVSTTATTKARVDSGRREISVGGSGLDDKSAYHEITHLNGEGFTELFNEGATDAIAAAIHEAADTGGDPYDKKAHYPSQANTLQTLERLSRGKIDTYEISRLYAGPDRQQNTIKLLLDIEDRAFDGIELMPYILQEVQEVKLAYAGKASSSDILKAEHILFDDKVQFLEDMYTNNQGRRIHHTPTTLITKMISPEMQEKYGKTTVKMMASYVVEAAMAKWDKQAAEERPNAADTV